MFLLLGLVALNGCSDQGKSESHEHSDNIAQYQCTMDCKNGKTYSEAGNCPVCGMKLALVEESGELSEKGMHEEKHDHEHLEEDHEGHHH